MERNIGLEYACGNSKVRFEILLSLKLNETKEKIMMIQSTGKLVQRVSQSIDELILRVNMK